MPAVRAERLCPNAIFLPPDFPRYRAVSRQAHEIFQRHTDLIEPLSLDEAYLDVSENKTGLPTATQVARTIREQIRSELNLTASAGVAPNKFLAKIASDWKKPDGLFVIQPEEVDSFLLPLAVDRLPGVGKVTEEKLKHLLENTPHCHSELALDCHSERSEESRRAPSVEQQSSLIAPCHSERSETSPPPSAFREEKSLSCHSERSRPTFSSRPAPAGRSASEVEESLFQHAPKGSGVPTIADLRKLDLPTLERHFGRYGVRLYELARGIDNSEVVPDRPTQSISAEDTFEQDVLLTEMEPMIRKLAEHTWAASRKESRIARTVVLKLKTSEFKILTRSHTPGSPPASCEELTNIALSLRERVGLSPHQRFRLVGVGLSNFYDHEDASAQSALFA
jgi:nucleotidyltransferase/DNA polymerase involved in DNA repair